MMFSATEVTKKAQSAERINNFIKSLRRRVVARTNKLSDLKTRIK